MPAHPHVLVATLGGQPQIVTFTLDLLLQQGFPISEVIVIHPRATSPSRLYRSLVHLNAEFVGGTYAETKQPIHFHSCVLEVDGRPLDDISDDAHADGTLNTIHHLLGDLKRRGYHIHLSVSGGRRLMSLLAISVASLNFDRYDHIWHIYTPAHIAEQVKDGACMHAPPESGVRLIQGQFIALGAYIYNPAQSFRIVQDEQRMQMEGQEHAYCKAVANQATPAQLKVLQAFARGLRPQQVADELSIALVTVHSHKTVLLSYCRNAWNIPDEERLDYHFLRGKFARYFHHDE